MTVINIDQINYIKNLKEYFNFERAVNYWDRKIMQLRTEYNIPEQKTIIIKLTKYQYEAMWDISNGHTCVFDYLAHFYLGRVKFKTSGFNPYPFLKSKGIIN